jgi:ribosome-associated protein
MEDIAHHDSKREVTDLAELLKLHNGVKVQVLDLTRIGFWTDYFIIVTATSSTHARGLLKRVKDFLNERNLETLRKASGGEDDDWNLVDCGNFVVHVMSERAREFYELERLWFQAETIYRSE